jgi:hypothetical protein
MKRKILLSGVLATILVFQAAAQTGTEKSFTVSGDLTTIYTLGNADATQLLDATPGGYYGSPSNRQDGAKKNGFYTAASLSASFKPEQWLDGYFRFLSTSRPGSFYLPLQMESYGAESFALALDSVYGKANVFSALTTSELPADLYVKAGKYKAEASNYGSVSKYGAEAILDMLETGNDFNYEIGGVLNLGDRRVSAGFVTNYLFNEAVQRYYDEDGGVTHGIAVVGEYDGQYLSMLKLQDLVIPGLAAEVLYGRNTGGKDTYSGNSFGFSAGYKPMSGWSIGSSGALLPVIGVEFGYFEKNLDVLSRSAILNESSLNNSTKNFRDTHTAGLAAGLRYLGKDFNIDINLAGVWTSVTHYYRNDISILKLSLDAMCTLDRYFIGGGFIAGTLSDVEWKTNSNVAEALDNYNHTFMVKENTGFEVYAGLFLSSKSKLVIGFNQNKGLALNNMLEAKTEGQVKYTQADARSVTSNKLVEAGGLYCKFVYSF